MRYTLYGGIRMKKTLVINPGATSTKIAMYEAKEQLWKQDIEHDADYVGRFEAIYDQFDFRYEAVIEAVAQHGDKLTDLACVMSRGGLLPPPLPSGAYEVTDEMIDVLRSRPMNHHPSNLGAAIALKIAESQGIKAYIYDPVTVDEMIDLVRITGLKGILRHGQGHTLNMRATALRYCEETGRDYKEQTLIVAHLGGGITFSLHHKGRIIDMVSDDEGAFSGARAGLIPGFKLTKLAYTDGMDYKKLMKKLQRGGGLGSLIGESDARKVEERIGSGDAEAKQAYDAMALTVAESIARLSVVVYGKVDQILLTGGIAYSKMFTDMITARVGFIAPVTVKAGENEMQALAEGAYRVLKGEEKAKQYKEPSERFF